MTESDTNQSLDEAVAEVITHCGEARGIVFVFGDFNIVHPGHLRLLKYAAERGEQLVVGVKADGLGNSHVPEDLRVESMASIGIVSHAFLLRHAPEDFIAKLRPAVVVKGHEHANADNPEEAVLKSYGGKLLFSSGDVGFSSLDLLQKELSEVNLSSISNSPEFAKRHGFRIEQLGDIVKKFSSLNVVVIGDLIVDEYVTCDALGMSQEDPTVVVTPIKTDRFVGGAGIVAAHAKSLGANARFFTIAGHGEAADFATEKLNEYGVNAHFVIDDDRPTTLKQRFRASGKTLLRVNHLSQQDISQKLIDDMLDNILPAIDKADVLIFSDFNYGCLPQALVDEVTKRGAARGVIMAADSQSSSQIGDISRFKGVHLVTPTEREARLALRNFNSGLVVLAEEMHQAIGPGVCFITLSQEGMLVHTSHDDGNGLITDQLPALNSAPKDVSGAGDSLVICAAMAMAVGATSWQSAYLGSIAAACQVSRIGNTPLSVNEIVQELML